MANTQIPSKGMDPRLHNHVVRYNKRCFSTYRYVLKSRSPRWLRASIRNSMYQNRKNFRQFRKEGYKRL